MKKKTKKNIDSNIISSGINGNNICDMYSFRNERIERRINE